MSTVIQFECRNPRHIRSGSSGPVSGVVMHHGTFGYCDGSASESDHRWIATGGVFLEQLISEDRDDPGDDAGHLSHERRHAGPLQLAR